MTSLLVRQTLPEDEVLIPQIETFIKQAGLPCPTRPAAVNVMLFRKRPLSEAEHESVDEYLNAITSTLPD